MPDPRNNADDAYAAYIGMPTDEWKAVFRSITFEHGVLPPAEMEGWERAYAERGLV